MSLLLLLLIIRPSCGNGRKYDVYELKYAEVLSTTSIQLIQNGKFKYCELLDYEGINDPDVVAEIHDQLAFLVDRHGIRYDAIWARSVAEAAEEGIDIKGGYLVSYSVAPFRGKNKVFDMVLILNIEELNKYNSLAELNKSISNGARSNTPQLVPGYRYRSKNNNNIVVTHVYENLKDVVTHDYGHLLTTPANKDKLSETLEWQMKMRDMVNLKGQMEYVFLLDNRIENDNDISEYAAKYGGSEMLAEIFARFYKNMLVTEEWANAFNNEMSKNAHKGVKGQIHPISGTH